MNDINIICVDDDPLCLEQVRIELEKVRVGLNTRYFLSPEEAFSAHTALPADIVILDLHMGSVNGISFISTMRNACRNAIYILLSEKVELQSALAALNEVHAFQFLTKPADAHTLQAAIEAAATEINLQRLHRISLVSHSTIEKMGRSIAYLDEDSRIVFCNESARDLIWQSDVFDLGREKILHSAHHSETLEFHELLRKLREGAEANSERGIFRFSGRASDHPVVASVVYHPGTDLNPACYSLVFSDPATQKTSVESISAALDILPSEAKVVQAIADGMTVEEAAKKSQISIHSARTYLRSVYEKTGVARQCDLVRLVLLTAA